MSVESGTEWYRKGGVRTQSPECMNSGYCHIRTEYEILIQFYIYVNLSHYVQGNIRNSLNSFTIEKSKAIIFGRGQ